MDRREFIRYVAAAGIAIGLFGCGRKRENKAEIVAGNAVSPNENLPAAVAEINGRTLSLPAPTGNGISAVSRTQWQAAAPIPTKMTAMGACSRITIHHEGNAQPNSANSPDAVAACLRTIQRAHCSSMNAGDIGYHFVVDRQGLLWQGRDLHYQGAHVKDNNSHNIGIMLLGNFELQQPTSSQVKMLGQLCRALMQGYHISSAQLFAHRELRNTACPGKNLAPYVATIRNQLRVV